jgi:hypothetical protein
MKVAAIVVVMLLLSACNSTPTSGPRATVQMRDGSRVIGMVVSSTSTELKVVGDDGVTHIIPMSTVRAVNYGEAPDVASSTVAPVAPVRRAPAASPAAPAQPTPSAVAPVSPVPEVPAATPPQPVAAVPAVTPVPEVAPLPRPTLDDVTTDTHVLPSGTEVSVQTNETIDGSTAADGQTFDANVTESVRDADGKVVIPAGAKAQILIKSLTQGGKIRGQSDLVLDLAAVSIDGRQYALSTADLEQKGKAGLGKNTRSAEFLGGGAAIGGIVGALLGGGKGAAIGAGAGAGGGALAQAATRGSIRVEAETILTFKLDMPLQVVQRRQ